MTETLFKCFDASQPPEITPPGCKAVLGYVGRKGYTPHVWTLQEWLRFKHLGQFPAWLPNLNDSPNADALLAVASVKRLGWAAHMPEGHERAIVCDVETSQNAAGYQEWAATVNAAGFWAVDYGSYSTVFGNAAYDVWAADWNGIPQLMPGQTVGADQYRASVPFDGTTIDLSVVSADMMKRAGIGPRHLVA
jgi:hypothetical protein